MKRDDWDVMQLGFALGVRNMAQERVLWFEGLAKVILDFHPHSSISF